jgi:hypothetical protein
MSYQPLGPAANTIAEAMQDNPLSRLTIKPELHINAKTKYTEQIGWRVTWKQVDSSSGGMIAWELYAIGKTPQEALQQFAADYQAETDTFIITEEGPIPIQQDTQNN